MKKLILAAALLLAQNFAASAYNSAEAWINHLGISGYAGGCFPGGGWCINSPTNETFNGIMKYEASTTDLWADIPASSPLYNQIGSQVSFESDSRIDPHITQQLGFSGYVFIAAGKYTITQTEGGSKIVHFRYYIQ